mmetsp:Transcript_19028/g.23156  ORF Transcript_19028/g.23156 Transcript_19028/m.23156 type:complete len:362 (-) Transcript_19028:145-1230(-)
MDDVSIIAGRQNQNVPLSSSERAQRKLQKKKEKERKRLKRKHNYSMNILKQKGKVKKENIEKLKRFCSESVTEKAIVERVTSKTGQKDIIENVLKDNLRQKMLDSLSIIVKDAFGDNKTLYLKNRRARVCAGRSLLKHMSKGTQTKDMFKNEEELKGYIKQKFTKRAILFFDTVRKCEIYNELWVQLGKVRALCSIGGGPGNDLAGSILMLEKYFNFTPMVASSFDWACENWSSMFSRIRNSLCKSRANIKMKNFFLEISDEKTDMVKFKEFDLFIFSYILTETRNKWHHFFRRIWVTAKPGAIFYFAEPCPWQLHILLSLFPHWRACADYFWIDSSMDFAESQRLNTRQGPAVLLVWKRG